MITRRDVQYIARLARIQLTPGEEEQFEQELSSILDFVAKLNEADTANAEPLTGGTELANVMREDAASVPRSSDAGSSLVDAAPAKRGGYVEVRAVFRRE